MEMIYGLMKEVVKCDNEAASISVALSKQEQFFTSVEIINWEGTEDMGIKSDTSLSLSWSSRVTEMQSLNQTAFKHLQSQGQSVSSKEQEEYYIFGPNT